LSGHVGAPPAQDDALFRILAIELGERLLGGNVCWTRLRACELARHAVPEPDGRLDERPGRNVDR
jgi:hypothetical protein